MVNCSVIGCSNESRPGSVYRFFSFPSDPPTHLLWRTRINRRDERTGKLWSPTKHSKVCSRHFEDCAYDVSPTLASKIGFTVSRFTIKKGYGPTLHLGHDRAPGLSQQSPKPGFAKRQRKQVTYYIIIHIINRGLLKSSLSCASNCQFRQRKSTHEKVYIYVESINEYTVQQLLYDTHKVTL